MDCYNNRYVCSKNYGYLNNSQYSSAIAYVSGGREAPNIHGMVIFTDVPGGTEVFTEFVGLPIYKPASGEDAPVGPLGFHIHEYGICQPGESDESFGAAGGHWNPTNQPHGNHAGDFPVIFSNNGYARMAFFTNKFKVQDVIGKSVIVHKNPDDYRTQPSGASGVRIACGVIHPMQ